MQLPRLCSTLDDQPRPGTALTPGCHLSLASTNSSGAAPLLPAQQQASILSWGHTGTLCHSVKTAPCVIRYRGGGLRSPNTGGGWKQGDEVSRLQRRAADTAAEMLVRIQAWLLRTDGQNSRSCDGWRCTMMTNWFRPAPDARKGCRAALAHGSGVRRIACLEHV